ncbi:EAL domain-containing protein [Alkalihalobacterium alkalinitrilicum]|uniref:bifunctional diguanylate cyclase/phosphodiesterase n=1 Tax=Alkalihalobacterium alkalinitrilicum TaxID=427920 RepID=UPI000995B05F|nr:GGDEF domain-containing phosphodiesterase [Alkalihalobacterium alkalinitrilicum]
MFNHYCCYDHYLNLPSCGKQCSLVVFRNSMFIILLLPVVRWLGKQYDKAKFLNEELQQSKAEFESLFRNNHIFFWSNDVIHKQLKVSKGIEKIYGYTQRDFEKNYELWLEVCHPEDKDKVDHYFQALLSGTPYRCEWRIFHKDGAIKWIESFGNPVFDPAGNVVKLNGVTYDNTERKQLEEKLQYMAYHDVLTGLPNRDRLNDYLHETLSQHKTNQQSLAVLFIDIDRFKFINNALGHMIGDTFLQQVSQRFVQCVRESDVVSRFGGDEFIVVLENSDQAQAKAIAERIIIDFYTPFILDAHEFFTSASIGISLYPNDGLDPETLIKQADTAMYLAKKSGKNTYQFYIQEDKNILDRKAIIERSLKRGLMNDEFYLHYQPKVWLITEEIYGVEALIRWQHPELGIVSPTEFIPIAEETGVIVPLGKWVLKQACKQNKKWQQTFDIRIMVAVNVSVSQFQDQYFIDSVKEVLEESKLSPEYLGLEITESVMQNPKQSAAIFQELKNLGIKISIDDFGTGYSSFSILGNLPIDLVKLDKSFVSEVTSNSCTAALVKTMIEMGKTLDFDLIAEGIEHEKQAEFLIENGCKYGQGYYYSPPLPASEAGELLKKAFL